MKEIGNRIKELREKRNLTLKDLGEAINFNFSNLSKVERGTRKPTIELLESLSAYFNVDIAYFFGEKQEIPKELQDIGAEWLLFSKEMKEQNLTPEQIKNIMKAIKSELNNQ
jgi:transcriptional regulator with XRE-family HTH domain